MLQKKDMASPFLRIGDLVKRRQGETVASQMKKLFLTEFDTSDKKADYNDNTDTWGTY